ncbi:lipopolysaccharide heptosyltransferase I [Oceanicoccus sp. KOV_DT_Chl]|uniref:lipopolysaccharide heptosyltransferase I n=1 Tax=Oceanicoccus sp. KOV_DT_Chl TaxID=1904639 RepID=UPI000C79A408|nr:lipopolysaccharide heptosyltransferase I [Oceanicoccus sp. KOV_DT_Chl]
MSKRVLLIKLTSMGDLMHALPALTDASRAFPGIQFDWVIDEAFADVASWHPSVNRIIPSAHRRWKKNLRQSIINGELKHFYQQLNQDDYDVIIDGQNNIKSATTILLRRGKAHGLDKFSIKEKPASWAYHIKHRADQSLHAISRQRLLFAQAIGYDLPDTIADFGIDKNRLVLPPDFELPERYLFFVHNASWSTKLWPDSHWDTLINQASSAGYQVLLPCGNDEELLRAQQLAASHDNAISLPKLPLTQVAAILNKAAGAVCCDTGLCHLAALLDIPAVSLYGPTDAKLIGATGLNQQHLIANDTEFPCSPCYKQVCSWYDSDQPMSACMQSLQPLKVWDSLSSLINNRDQQH